MKLQVIGTGSKGNCYILSNKDEALIIECGVKFDKIQKALDYNLTKVVGCLMSHSHGDHSKSLEKVLNAGINVYSSYEAFYECGFDGHHNANQLLGKLRAKIGGFEVMPFPVNHDVKCYGFLIKHSETGLICFITDTYYCNYTFPGVNNFIVEANYSKSILDKRVIDGKSPMFLRNRVIESHFSLENCKDFLKANDLKKVNNIVLIHLSDSNSDEKLFKKEIEELTGKSVHVAKDGYTIENFDISPF